MSKLHESEYDPYRFEPDEGQRGLLCSNNESLSRCPSLRSNPKLSKETLESLEELGSVLRYIRKRMYAEGFEIVNGVLMKCVNEYE